jgi:uncharacterized OB-fold protein
MGDDRDLRRKPGRWSEEEGAFILPDEWRLSYYVSCGELSPFFRAVKEEGKLLGMRCPSCGSVFCPPRSWCHECYVDTEWVEMRGTGELTAWTTVYFATSDLVEKVPFRQGGVRLDGARYPIVGRLEVDDESRLVPGARLRVSFKPPEQRQGRVSDYFFVLEDGD